ncbi:hypothetical protein ABT112_04265 [Streptomyces sp. NPDC002055]|uniref:hypothetical protein n=1 Tax=Streptomyces sp. NPDC002055 TaxID=3154534 RepID=UPI0033171B18
MKTENRAAVLAAAGALLMGGTLSGATAAQAAEPSVTYKFQDDPRKSFGVVVYNHGRYAGMAYWQADPIPAQDVPGDAIQAVDPLADGWGVEAILDTGGGYRTVSTRGHDSPYLSPYKTGDLTEGSTVRLRVCLVKGLNSYCSPYYSGKA